MHEKWIEAKILWFFLFLVSCIDLISHFHDFDDLFDSLSDNVYAIHALLVETVRFSGLLHLPLVKWFFAASREFLETVHKLRHSFCIFLSLLCKHQSPILKMIKFSATKFYFNAGIIRNRLPFTSFWKCYCGLHESLGSSLGYTNKRSCMIMFLVGAS